MLDSLHWIPYLLCLTGYLVSSESVDKFSLRNGNRKDEVVNWSNISVEVLNGMSRAGISIIKVSRH